VIEDLEAETREESFDDLPGQESELVVVFLAPPVEGDLFDELFPAFLGIQVGEMQESFAAGFQDAPDLPEIRSGRCGTARALL
jgi:hypothetical protein